jgi:hypothetical protein
MLDKLLAPVLDHISQVHLAVVAVGNPVPLHESPLFELLAHQLQDKVFLRLQQ